MVIMFEYKETQHLLEMELKQLEDLDFADDVAEISWFKKTTTRKIKNLEFNFPKEQESVPEVI